MIVEENSLCAMPEIMTQAHMHSFCACLVAFLWAFVPHDFQLYIYQLDSISLFSFVFFALLFFYVRHILKLL